MDKWYVIRIVANKEKEAKENIDLEVKHSTLKDLVKQVIIPYEKVMHLRKGKKVITTRNHLPGYILIETDENSVSELSSMFKRISFVSGFLGNKTPTPLRDKEVQDILGKLDELKNSKETLLDKFIIGEFVKIIDGPFSNFVGSIIDINEDKNKLKLNVRVFDRETPLELNFVQVMKELKQ